MDQETHRTGSADHQIYDERTLLESTGIKSHMLNNCNLKKSIDYFRDPFKDFA